MDARRPLLAVLAVALGAAACAEPRSPRCKTLCAREAECVEDQGGAATESAFDEGDCVAACAALERDAEGRGTVELHADCVATAGAACAAVLDCP